MCRFLYILPAHLHLESFLDISLHPSGFGQSIINERQNVICSISVPPDVDPLTIMKFGWLDEDDIITDDSRVTIDTSSDYYNDSSLVTIIQFDPLIEDDQGEYICFAVMNESLIFEVINLINFTSELYICVYEDGFELQCSSNVSELTFTLSQLV